MLQRLTTHRARPQVDLGWKKKFLPYPVFPSTYARGLEEPAAVLLYRWYCVCRCVVVCCVVLCCVVLWYSKLFKQETGCARRTNSLSHPC